MQNKRSYAVLGVLWLSLVFVAWLVAVPTSFSLATLAWFNAVALAGAAALMAARNAARPTRSIAGILDDTKHPTEARRLTR